MIVSIFILILALGGLLQFSVAYCRSLLIAYGKVEISERTRELAGIGGDRIEPEGFGRLMAFVRMAPDPGDDSMDIQIVKMYFRVMNFARSVTAPISARMARWTEGELSSCAYFAAVTLDRRMPPLS